MWAEEDILQSILTISKAVRKDQAGQIRSIHKPPPQAMSSDNAYSNFLDKANQDTGASKASALAKTANTKAVDTDVPMTLKAVEQYYTSEADEPFEPVSLKWDGRNMPSESISPQILLGLYYSKKHR